MAVYKAPTQNSDGHIIDLSPDDYSEDTGLKSLATIKPSGSFAAWRGAQRAIEDAEIVDAPPTDKEPQDD